MEGTLEKWEEEEASLTQAQDRKGGKREPTIFPKYLPIWIGFVQRLGRVKSVAPKSLGLKLGITWEGWNASSHYHQILSFQTQLSGKPLPISQCFTMCPDESIYPTRLESRGKWYTERLSLWAFSYTAWFHVLTRISTAEWPWASYWTSWSHGISF